MTASKTMFFAALALFVLMGSMVSAVEGSSDSATGAAVAVPVLKDDSAMDAKAKLYEEYQAKLMMEKQAMQAKVAKQATLFGKELSGDDATVVSVLADRIPAEKMKILSTLSVEDRAKVLAKLKAEYKDAIDVSKATEDRKAAIEARLKEIKDAQSTGDETTQIKARLELAKKTCEEQNANDTDACKAILIALEKLGKKIKLTTADVKDAGMKLGQLRVAWVEKHYAEWLDHAQGLDSKLTRVDTKLEELVTRATAANADAGSVLSDIQAKFKRIHAAYQEKMAAMKDAYATFETDKTLKNALLVRARYLELRAYGKFAVHAVNRFVYLYHGMIDDGSSDSATPTITATDAAAIVAEIPEPTQIQAEADAEIASSVATDDVPATALVDASVSTGTVVNGSTDSDHVAEGENAVDDSSSSDSSANDEGVTQ